MSADAQAAFSSGLQPLPHRRRQLWGRLWFLVEVGVVCFFASKALLFYWQARWAQDDAYISFRFAKHLVQGHGLVYNPGERVEGYTNFLWTLLAAIPLAFGAEDPLPFMHGLSLVLWLGSYLLLLAFGVVLYRKGNWIAPLAPLPLLFHWSYNMWFFSGMETPLVSFLVIVTLLCFARDPEKNPLALMWTSLAAMTLLLVRADGVVIVAGVAVAGLLLDWRALLQRRKWLEFVVLPALPVLLLFVPYTLWRVSYYGSFFPNTYYAKAAYLTYYQRGWEYLRTYVAVFRFLPWLSLPLASVVLSPKGSERRFLVGSLCASLSVFWYVVRLGGDFMEWRFVTPVTGVLYPAIVIAAGSIAQRVAAAQWEKVGQLWGRGGKTLARLSPAVVWSAVFVATLAFVRVTKASEKEARNVLVPGQETIALLSRYCDPEQMDWGTVGRVLDQVLPQNVKIATTSAGIIPFFCDRPCLDLHGLTDPVIARQPIDPAHRGRMGHEHWLTDYEEMRRRGVDVVLPWAEPKPVALAATTPPQPNFELISVRLPNDLFVEFIVLNHQHVNVARLKKDPRLVFFSATDTGGRHDFYVFRNRYTNWHVVDFLDLEEEFSQASHAFKEIIPANAPCGHNYHTKRLPYAGAWSSVIFADNGVRLWGQAQFSVHRVRAGLPLVMVVRHDQSGTAEYEVEVNGQKLAGRLSFSRGFEAWNELVCEIPAEVLVEGTNRVVLSRLTSSPEDAELYYLWFLQPNGAADE